MDGVPRVSLLRRWGWGEAPLFDRRVRRRRPSLATNPVSFEVSTDEPSYSVVRRNGIASTDPGLETTVLRDLVERSLRSLDSSLGRRLVSESDDEATIDIDVDAVFTRDFTDRMADAVDDARRP